MVFSRREKEDNLPDHRVYHQEARPNTNRTLLLTLYLGKMFQEEQPTYFFTYMSRFPLYTFAVGLLSFSLQFHRKWRAGSESNRTRIALLLRCG